MGIESLGLGVRDEGREVSAPKMTMAQAIAHQKKNGFPWPRESMESLPDLEERTFDSVKQIGEKCRKLLAIKTAQTSPLEEIFIDLWTKCDGPLLKREVFIVPGKRWRVDFAHCKSKTAIEIEGGVYMMGRHQRPAGFSEDCKKYLAITLLGWRVIRLTGSQLSEETIRSIIEFIIDNQTEAKKR